MKKAISLAAAVVFLALSATPSFAAQYKATQDYLNAMDARGIHYALGGINSSTQAENVEVVYRGDNMDEIKIECYFPSDNSSASFFCWNVIDFDAEKAGNTLIACDSLNSSYKFAKFYLDLKDNSVTMNYDIKFDPNMDCGNISVSALQSMVNIVDDAYPSLAPYQNSGGVSLNDLLGKSE